MRRRILSSICVSVLTVCCVFASERPNVLLVLSDDHSFPHLGAYGCSACDQFELTPHLDAFAREALVFNKAYVTTPQGSPSRISIFTGLDPLFTATSRYGQPAAAHIPFFTDALRADGYWAGLAGQAHQLNGVNLGADHQQNVLAAQGLSPADFVARFDYVKEERVTTANATAVLGQALDAVPSGKPFFLCYGLSELHRPFGSDFSDIDTAKLAMPADFPNVPEVKVDYAQYLQSLKAVDVGFGNVIAELQARGVYDNTIIVFMGDNGESLLRAKGTLYDRGTHVPLVVRHPQGKGYGESTDVLVSGLDVSATILDAVGVEPTNSINGVSFLNALTKGNEDAIRSYAFAQRGWQPEAFDYARSVTDGRYLFVMSIFWDLPYRPLEMWREPAWDAMVAASVAGELRALHKNMYFPEERVVYELFDLQNDPYQLFNLFGRREVSIKQQELVEAMDIWMLGQNDFLPNPTYTFEKMGEYIEEMVPGIKQKGVQIIRK